jgi:hypothetical protein
MKENKIDWVSFSIFGKWFLGLQGHSVGLAPLRQEHFVSLCSVYEIHLF